MRPKLQAREFASYGELAGRPLPERLTIVFVPSLAALRTKARELNGAALTEKQVLAIRDGSKVMVVDHDAAHAVKEKRDYADIDAVNARQSWLQLPESQS